MNILILGGTGAMGIHLVSLLHHTKHRIYVTSRSYKGNYQNIEYIIGNAHDARFLDCLLEKKWDCIVDFMIYTTVEFKNRVEKILKSTEHYIFLSSARVYAASVSPLTEDSPRLLDVCIDTHYLETDEYALTKARQEDILLQSGFCNYTIIRPYITYSEMRLQLGTFEKEIWLRRVLQGKIIVLPQEMAKCKTTLTHGINVAEGIAAIISNGSNSHHTVYHITHSRSLTWEDVANIYMKIIKQCTHQEMKIAWADMESYEKIMGKSYQLSYDRLIERCFDNRKIGNLIKIEAFIDPEEGLGSCVKSFIEQGAPFLLPCSYGVEGRMDRYTKERTSLWHISGIKNKIKYEIKRRGILK